MLARITGYLALFIDLTWYPTGLERCKCREMAIVIDVIRFSSTVVTALNLGVKAIIPVESIDELIYLANKLGALKVGEVNGIKIPEADLDNSPTDLINYCNKYGVPKYIVIRTTAGVPTLLKCKELGLREIVILALLNVGAVAKHIHEKKPSCICIVCSGWRGRNYAFEDHLAAGLLISRLIDLGATDLKELSIEALSALALYKGLRDLNIDLKTLIMSSSSAKDLNETKRKRDIDYCLKIDAYDLVPIMINREIIKSSDKS